MPGVPPACEWRLCRLPPGFGRPILRQGSGAQPEDDWKGAVTRQAVVVAFLVLAVSAPWVQADTYICGPAFEQRMEELLAGGSRVGRGELCCNPPVPGSLAPRMTEGVYKLGICATIKAMESTCTIRRTPDFDGVRSRLRELCKDAPKRLPRER